MRRIAVFFGIVAALVVAVSVFFFLPMVTPFPFSTPSPSPVFYSPTAPSLAIAVLNGTEFSLEITNTLETRARGLSGRDSIPERGGMVFLFDPPERPAFWMKDMRFPLDMVWVRNSRIIGITENIPAPLPETPEASLLRYAPPELVDEVIELSAGTAKAIGLRPGQNVRLLLP